MCNGKNLGDCPSTKFVTEIRRTESRNEGGYKQVCVSNFINKNVTEETNTYCLLNKKTNNRKHYSSKYYLNLSD
jgi:hypothetical protein